MTADYPVFFFADSTILVHFARIGRVDLLERLLNGRGRWCGTVAEECSRLSVKKGLPELGRYGDILGDPIFAEGSEYVDMQVLRSSLAAPTDHRREHLGEADTIAIMCRRFNASTLITDDHRAYDLARVEGLRAVTTWDFFRLAVRVGYLEVGEAWGYVVALEGDRRSHRYPYLSDWNRFEIWCRES